MLKSSSPSLLLLCLAAAALSSSSTVVNAAIYECKSASDIYRYMRAAVAGDELVLHPGTYIGRFSGYQDADENNPITMRALDPSNKPVLDGLGDRNYATVGLYITGNYWSLQDLIVHGANKGIIFDNAVGGEILNCEVRNTGEEAIHIRDGSSNVLIEGNYVHTTGLFTAGFGEAIYIGSDKGHHQYYDATVFDVTVRDNIIGPYVKAEGIDVREGTHDVLIEYNTFDATGLAGQNSADSFIDLKGTRTIVRYNTFHQNGNSKLNKGVNIIDRGVDKSAYDHVIRHNTFNMETKTAPMVRANQNTENVYVYDNKRSPSGSSYGGSLITDGSTPDWYTDGTPKTDISESYAIYANTAVNTDYWKNDSTGGFFLYNFNDGAAHQSCAFAQLQDQGKVHFEADGADLTGLRELRFFVRAMSPDVKFRMKVNGISGTVNAGLDWIEHSLFFGIFMKGEDVQTVMFENTSGEQITLLFDDIRFVER